MDGGAEDIDLSVVLGDQLIPIVCASTDRNQCLIAYGLFLHGEDKDPPSLFPQPNLNPAQKFNSNRFDLITTLSDFDVEEQHVE